MTSLPQLKIPPGPFAAHLFDCDGTIADTMPLHYSAWLHILAPYSVAFPEARFYELAGVPPVEILNILNRENGLQMPVKEMFEIKEKLFQELLPQIQPIHSVVEQVRLHAGKIPIAVVSGSPRQSVVKTLQTLGLLELFDVLVCSEDYKQGKPHPEPFLRAAELLKVDPEKCLVYEDARAGIESAKSAGMQWVFVPPLGKETTKVES